MFCINISFGIYEFKHFTIRLKLQEKFNKFKQRHNNVFKKSFTSPRRNIFNKPTSNKNTNNDEDDSIEVEEDNGNKRYGKRIDLIRNSVAFNVH